MRATEGYRLLRHRQRGHLRIVIRPRLCASSTARLGSSTWLGEGACGRGGQDAGRSGGTPDSCRRHNGVRVIGVRGRERGDVGDGVADRFGAGGAQDGIEASVRSRRSGATPARRSPCSCGTPCTRTVGRFEGGEGGVGQYSAGVDPRLVLLVFAHPVECFVVADAIGLLRLPGSLLVGVGFGHDRLLGDRLCAHAVGRWRRGSDGSLSLGSGSCGTFSRDSRGVGARQRDRRSARLGRRAVRGLRQRRGDRDSARSAAGACSCETRWPP
ncbi:hypothetical protein ABH925_007162 [Streptacidiphilus sp. EB129]